MSLRHLRKLVGPSTIPPPSESSDEEYEPLYVKNSNRSTYEGLVVSSSSDSEHETVVSTPEESEPGDKKEEKKGKKKNKKNKKKKMPKDYNDLDEIDRSVREVNALLGEPPEPVVVPEQKPEPSQTVLATNYKHLDVTYELDRIFGRDTDEEKSKRRGRQPPLKRIQRNMIIRKQYNLKNKGLYMSIDRREGDLTFFTFDHNRDYQKNHKEFLLKLIQMHQVYDVNNSVKNMHIEGLVEVIDMMFRTEDYSGASNLIEQIIAYVQYIAHPSFNITDIRNRLEYKFLENRAFHIILLKYLHLLTNRACHRTSLEIAKLLLNLDPSDPLAVVFIIDTLAIRAREHQWLIEAIDYLDKERDAGFLFNIKFSYALAHFHVASKKRESLAHCDELLQKAMIIFPWTVKEFLDASKQFSDEKIRTHELYDKYATTSTCRSLKKLTHLFVAFAGSWWNEQPVREWFLRNARELAVKYDNDPSIKAEVLRMELVRNTLFRGIPTEVLRHLSVIKYMADLLIDREIPYIEHTYGFDPHPSQNVVNRYKYMTSLNIAYLQLTLDSALITNFFASLSPNYEVPNPEQIHESLFSRPALNLLRNEHNIIGEGDHEERVHDGNDNNEIDNVENNENDSDDENGDSEDTGDEADESDDEDEEAEDSDDEDEEDDDGEDDEDTYEDLYETDDSDDDESETENTDDEEDDDDDEDDEDEGNIGLKKKIKKPCDTPDDDAEKNLTD